MLNKNLFFYLKYHIWNLFSNPKYEVDNIP